MKLCDGNIKHVLPGKGDVRNHKVIETLLKNSFDGWITLKWKKIWHPELADAEVILPYFIDYLSKLEL